MENVPLLLFLAWVIHDMTATLRVICMGPIRIEFYERRKGNGLSSPDRPASRTLPPVDAEDSNNDDAGDGTGTGGV